MKADDTSETGLRIFIVRGLPGRRRGQANVSSPIHAAAVAGKVDVRGQEARL